MSGLDVAQICFIAVVVVVGFVGIFLAIKKENKKR